MTDRYQIYRPEKANTSNNYVKQVKSVHYKAQCNHEENIRFGAVISKYIEVDAYIVNDDNIVSIGEQVQLIWRHDYNEDFTPKNTITGEYIAGFRVYDVQMVDRSTYRFTAYDDIKKLEKDYSARLRELNDNGSFPIPLADLVIDAANVAGVSFLSGSAPNTTHYPGVMDINSFYSDGVTCADIFSWYAELNATFLACNIYNKLYFRNFGPVIRPGFYSTSRYVICPSDQGEYYDGQTQLVNVFYKQDGLNVSSYDSLAVDQVQVLSSNGTLLGRYPTDVSNPTNIYYLSGNPFTELCSLYDRIAWIRYYAAQTLYDKLINIGQYKPMEAKLFPFRFPYDIGVITFVADTHGNMWRTAIMNVDVTDEEVFVGSYGNENYQSVTGAYNTADQKVTSLDIRMNSLEGGGGGGSVISPTENIAIPSSGSSVSKNMTGLTSDHELVRWNFSSSPENMPPVNLSWATYDGYFVITNNSGTTSEYMRPVFAKSVDVAVSNY